MPRPKSLQPQYCLHKSSGRAFVTLDGSRVYLGKHGTQESRDEYATAIGEWIARGRRPEPPSPDTAAAAAGLTISALIHPFWQHAKTYYVHRDGTPTSEQDNIRQALRPLMKLYGRTPAASFGPLQLKALRAEMLKPTTATDAKTGKLVTRSGWSRTNTNRHIARVKLMFKLAVSNELVPATIYQALATIGGLAGRP